MRTYNCIYLITNKINGKIYIGKHSTDNLDDGYMGSGLLIKKAIQKCGIENFTKEYLAFCDTEEKLNWLEKFYIKKYKAREVGYNLTDGGDGHLGFIMSEETKEKISKSHKGITSPFKGIARQNEVKEKISNSLFGHHHNKETRQKMSDSKKGKPSAFKEQHHSEETKRKISEGHKGKSKPKYKWLTPTGEIKNMAPHIVSRYHKDWKLIEQV